LALLLMAIFILSLGADEARHSVTRASATPWRQALGVGAGCLSGMCYAILNVLLRRCILRGAPLSTTLATVSMTGVLSLTLIAWLRIGTPGMLATSPTDFLLMLGAGICNTVAFVALTKSLQLTNVVYVNALNATQATLAALAGVLIFHEALSPWLATGVALTIAGLLVLMWAHRAMIQPRSG
jgi:drug/metabolite transporter (DMT)-like permease